MSGQPVVVTGIGVISALGASMGVLGERIFSGDCGVGPLRLFDPTGYATSQAAEATVAAVAGRSRSDTLALTAARAALSEARLDPRNRRVGLLVGASVGGMFETEEVFARWWVGGVSVDPALARLHPTSAPAEAVHDVLGPFAMVRTVCSACASGAAVLGLGRAMVRRGDFDAVLVGGVDALSRLTLAGFGALSALDPSPSRPFHARRRGITLGEAAAFFVLERQDEALARGASS